MSSFKRTLGRPKRNNCTGIEKARDNKIYKGIK